MRVLHVIDTLDPRGGGPPAVAVRLAAAQQAAGVETLLVSHPAADPSLVDQSFASVPGIAGVKRCSVPRPSRTRQILRSPIADALKQIVCAGDVLHLHGVWDAIIRSAADIAHHGGLPYVVAPHGMLDPWSLRQKQVKKRLALFLGYRRMLNRASLIHVLNADEQSLLAPLRLRAPMHVIPNGIFPEELEPAPPADGFRTQHPSLGDRPYVLFLSRLHFKKGLDFLADAFALVSTQIPDARLVVVGPDGGARGPFEDQIRSLGLTARVLVLDALYGPSKIAALSGAACFCLPSRQEGFSMAIVEALACGTPAVISEACHFPEVAEAGAGEVTALAAPAIAGALERVLRNVELRERMGAAGKKLVAERYTWPRIAEQTLEAYASLSRRNPRRGN